MPPAPPRVDITVKNRIIADLRAAIDKGRIRLARPLERGRLCAVYRADITTVAAALEVLLDEGYISARGNPPEPWVTEEHPHRRRERGVAAMLAREIDDLGIAPLVHSPVYLICSRYEFQRARADRVLEMLVASGHVTDEAPLPRSSAVPLRSLGKGGTMRLTKDGRYRPDENAATQMRADIASGALAPGTRLTTRDLSQRFRLSRYMAELVIDALVADGLAHPGRWNGAAFEPAWVAGAPPDPHTAAEIADFLRAEIESGRIAFGVKLSRPGLVARFGVPGDRIVTATKMLKSTGHLQSSTGRHLRVTDPCGPGAPLGRGEVARDGEEAARRVADAIATGELAPGAPLSRSALRAVFNLTAAAAAAALPILARRGLVDPPVGSMPARVRGGPLVGHAAITADMIRRIEQGALAEGAELTCATVSTDYGCAPSTGRTVLRALERLGWCTTVTTPGGAARESRTMAVNVAPRREGRAAGD